MTIRPTVTRFEIQATRGTDVRWFETVATCATRADAFATLSAMRLADRMIELSVVARTSVVWS